MCVLQENKTWNSGKGRTKNSNHDKCWWVKLLLHRNQNTGNRTTVLCMSLESDTKSHKNSKAQETWLRDKLLQLLYFSCKTVTVYLCTGRTWLSACAVLHAQLFAYFWTKIQNRHRKTSCPSSWSEIELYHRILIITVDINSTIIGKWCKRKTAHLHLPQAISKFMFQQRWRVCKT